ncbi:MAG: N-formylglutamate amidohydrolase [Rhodospirillaceae bacterium]|nr:N-formylglutamate amidohydrolase [Rhodospirillaceae bacterium]
MPRTTELPRPDRDATGSTAEPPSGGRLLAPDEPPPVVVERETGASPFVLVCDHAGNRLPRAVGTLGVPEAERRRHIAWDIGAAEVSRRLSAALDAALVLQPYSRLVIDCNRDPAVATSIVTLSELTEIPGNRDLPPAARAARRGEIFEPYHARIRALLDARQSAGRPTALIAMHSFTPVFKGVPRPWHVGVLYNRDRRLAALALDLLRAEPGLTVGDNEPYAVSDETDYTIPRHGEARGLPHVEFEIRQDLIEGPEGQQAWADRLARLLRAAAERLTLTA